MCLDPELRLVIPMPGRHRGPTTLLLHLARSIRFRWVSTSGLGHLGAVVHAAVGAVVATEALSWRDRRPRRSAQADHPRRRLPVPPARRDGIVVNELFDEQMVQRRVVPRRSPLQ
jgi:hypothetical protein